MKKKLSRMKNGIYVLLVLIFLNIVAHRSGVQWDFTEDRRFTLAPTTRELVRALNEPVTIEVYLTGDFPAIFTSLEKQTQNFLTRFSRINPNIMVRYENPSIGSVEQVNKRREEFVNQGLAPVRLSIRDESTEKLIFPYALIQFGMKKVYVNLLESERAGIPNEETVARSVEQLEYKFASGLMRLFQEKKKNIIFTTGHGELTPAETADWENGLRAYFNTTRVDLDSLTHIPGEIDVVVIAQPEEPFSEKDKFKLDQYLMRGGRLMFLLDKMRVSEDSLMTRGHFVSTDYDLNLDDLLFKYGVRLQSNLILSLDNTRRPMVVGRMGGENQYELFPWYYYLAARPDEQSVITQGLDRVQLKYASVIEPLESDTEKIPLLTAGEYSRYQFNPAEISLDIVRYEPDVSAFSHRNIPVALLVQGEFESLFKNRVTSHMRSGLEELNLPFRESSDPTQIIIVSDGDIARNGFDSQRRRPRPLGFDPFENYTFDNKAFLNNAVEYMTGMGAILPLRARKVPMRMLDKQKVDQYRVLIQTGNLLIPIAGFLLMSYAWRFYRKRKYTRS